VPLTLIGVVAGVGWASGISIYLVAALVGLFGRLGVLDAPDALTSTPVLVGATALFAVEFFADKIPQLDTVWNAVHTLVRPVGAAAITALLAGDLGEGLRLGASLSAGTLSVVSHGSKSAVRAGVNASPEPASNGIISTVEHALAGFVVWLAANHPLITIAVVAVLTIFGIWLAVRAVRLLTRAVRATGQRLRSLVPGSGRSGGLRARSRSPGAGG
jgi:uncharacterized membrane protein YccF (DUF307 family)